MVTFWTIASMTFTFGVLTLVGYSLLLIGGWHHH